MGVLDGRTARVAGAGRGIGRGIAMALTAEGATVVVNGLGAKLDGEGVDTSPADVVAREIKELGGTAASSHGSVADWDQAHAMVDQVIMPWSKIDILINVAGILRDRMIFNMAKEEWQAVLAVHLDGTFYCTRTASVHMREQKYGRIISMSSVSALGALCHRLLGRPASGSGRLCHGDGGHEWGDRRRRACRLTSRLGLIIQQ